MLMREEGFEPRLLDPSFKRDTTRKPFLWVPPPPQMTIDTEQESDDDATPKEKQDRRDLMHKGLAMQSALTALEAESAELDDDDGTVPNRTDDSGAGGSGSGRPPSAKDRREAAKESRNHGELNDASRPSAARKKRNRRSEKESEPAMVCMHLI
jgi:hypothetical protein